MRRPFPFFPRSLAKAFRSKRRLVNDSTPREFNRDPAPFIHSLEFFLTSIGGGHGEAEDGAPQTNPLAIWLFA